MGRCTTGAITTEEVSRIELSYLLKNGKIKRGNLVFGEIAWNDGNSVGFKSCLIDDEAYIQLSYQSTYHNTGEKEDFNYTIQLVGVPSNLGQGEVLYFLCPVTNRRCRILYKCYGSKIWKSRFAYNSRIYYSCQTRSKKGYYHDRYWTVEKRLGKIPLPVKKHYKGVQTRAQRRIQQMKKLLSYYDDMRYMILEKELLRWGLESN